MDEDGGDEGKCGAQENIAANFFFDSRRSKKFRLCET